MPPKVPPIDDPNAPVTVEPFADPSAWAFIQPWYERSVAGDPAWTQAAVVLRPGNAGEFFNTQFYVQGFLTHFEEATGTIGLSGTLRTQILSQGLPQPTYIEIRKTTTGLVIMKVKPQGSPEWVFESPNVYNQIHLDLVICVIDGFGEDYQTEVRLLASIGERRKVAGP
jgi:hypothetical protein